MIECKARTLIPLLSLQPEVSILKHFLGDSHAQPGWTMYFRWGEHSFFSLSLCLYDDRNHHCDTSFSLVSWTLKPHDFHPFSPWQLLKSFYSFTELLTSYRFIYQLLIEDVKISYAFMTFSLVGSFYQCLLFTCSNCLFDPHSLRIVISSW